MPSAIPNSSTTTSTAAPVAQEPAYSTQATPVPVKTPEIIRILEKENVAFVATTHSQTIFIQLKDGRAYEGMYVPAEAGEYAKDPNLSDVLNLTIQIQKKRAPEEVTDWRIMCE